MSYKFRKLSDEAVKRLNSIKNRDDILFNNQSIVINWRSDLNGSDYIVDIIDLENYLYIAGVTLKRVECFDFDSADNICMINSDYINLRKRNNLCECLVGGMFGEYSEDDNALISDKMIICPIFSYQPINASISEPVAVRVEHIYDALYGVVIYGDYENNLNLMDIYKTVMSYYLSKGHIVLKYVKYVPLNINCLKGITVSSFSSLLSNPGPTQTCADRCFHMWYLYYKGSSCKDGSDIQVRNLDGLREEQYKVIHSDSCGCKQC